MNGQEIIMNNNGLHTENGIRKILNDHHQDHVLENWNSFDEKQRKMLSNANIPDMYTALKRNEQLLNTSCESNIDAAMEPVEENCFGSVPNSTKEQVKKWEDNGLKEVAQGHVAVILLAGGQGSRLGVKYPKGMFDVGLPSGKTLYQLQAERIFKLQQIAKQRFPSNKDCVIPWYIMTSDSTKLQTVQFFEKNDYFKLNKNNVIIFEQFTLPCIDFNGKLILETANKVTSAPDGNGGLYKALKNCKILDDIQKRGIKSSHIYCVDNILVKMADPAFIGFCLDKNAECGAKVVEKTKPDEAVGVVCKVNGVYQVVEYSEITKETSEKMDASNTRLMFSAGNICNHYFTTEFLEKVCDEKQERKLQYHIAKKKIPSVNNPSPTEPNGYKLEKFVFDVFKFAEKFAVLEVSREDEFSPLKRADEPNKVGGFSNPRTSRYALMHLHHRQIINAGGRILNKNGEECVPVSEGVGDYPIQCEISPLLSYDGENLEGIVAGKSFKSPYVIEF